MLGEELPCARLLKLRRRRSRLPWIYLVYQRSVGAETGATGKRHVPLAHRVAEEIDEPLSFAAEKRRDVERR